MLISVESFQEYKGTTIALYGLGAETKNALQSLEKDFEIVGLLDSFRAEGELYGRPIISIDDAIHAGIQLIIVVARPGSCKAITKRIEDKCRRAGIALMDIRGRNLLEARKVSYCFSDIARATRAELEEKIRNADVVSFDLFDTLVMRQTLYSDDIIAYVDCKLKESGIFIEDFCKNRLGSEKELSRNRVPTLTEIYQNMMQKRKKYKERNITAAELANLEWDIDFEFLVSRKEMCDIFRETVESGKKVYIVSDTYYSKKQLIQILKKCNITKYTDILSSSDCKVSKQQGLYSVLKDRENAGRYLHIGDDIVADIESACNCGLDTYRVFSGLDLLEDVGGLGLEFCADSLSDNLKIGMFVARIFNSPFQFEKQDRYIEIKDVYDIGYLLCAPVISDFVIWFYNKMKEQKFQNIWFGARDGYLIREMYSYLLDSLGCNDGTVYFLTSRIAAIRAGVQDEEDIQYVDEMKFSGTLEENLKERFGIDLGFVKSEDILVDKKGLLQYKKIILRNAQKEYENYEQYIARLVIEEGDIAFFDFVAKGTVQMYVQRLVDRHLKGFYFLQLEKEYMKEKKLDIESFFGNVDTDFGVIYDNYYILEPLLTALHPSICSFDEEGMPVYADDTRSNRSILCIERAQTGILDYFKAYIKLCAKAEQKLNKKLDEVFLGLIHKIKITDDDFMDLMIEDPFFNRMTNITDVI